MTRKLQEKPRTEEALTSAPLAGIMAAAVDPRDPWAAIKSLREGMKAIRKRGEEPTARFLQGMGNDGTIADVADSRMLVLGYDV